MAVHHKFGPSCLPIKRKRRESPRIHVSCTNMAAHGTRPSPPLSPRQELSARFCVPSSLQSASDSMCPWFEVGRREKMSYQLISRFTNYYGFLGDNRHLLLNWAHKQTRKLLGPKVVSSKYSKTNVQSPSSNFSFRERYFFRR